jgi:hypothetical protein
MNPSHEPTDSNRVASKEDDAIHPKRLSCRPARSSCSNLTRQLEVRGARLTTVSLLLGD